MFFVKGSELFKNLHFRSDCNYYYASQNINICHLYCKLIAGRCEFILLIYYFCAYCLSFSCVMFVYVIILLHWLQLCYCHAVFVHGIVSHALISWHIAVFSVFLTLQLEDLRGLPAQSSAHQGPHRTGAVLSILISTPSTATLLPHPCQACHASLEEEWGEPWA